MENLFNRTTTIVSLILTLIAAAGIIITPDNLYIIIISIIALLMIIIFIDKFSQIDINTKNINELNKSLDMERRFNKIENNISEQNGKLSMVMKK
ncbi:MAG: hypothetical protein AABX19_04730 [Nanoarchaeota archaeon]